MNIMLHHAGQRLRVMAWPLAVGVGCWMAVVATLRMQDTLQLFFGPVVQWVTALVLLQLARGHQDLFAEGWPMASLPIKPRQRALGEGLVASGALVAIGAICVGIVAALLQLDELPQATLVIARWGIGTAPLLLVGSLAFGRTGGRETAGWMMALAVGQGVAVALLPEAGPVTLALIALGGAMVAGLAAALGLLDGRLPERAPAPEAVWQAPAPPRRQLARQLWVGLPRDAGRASAIGLVVALFFVGVRMVVDQTAAPDLINAGILVLTVTAVITPWLRQNLPSRVVPGGSDRDGGFLRAYRVLPLPGWLILRSMVLHSLVVFGVIIATAFAIVGAAWFATGVRPTLAALPLGAVYAAPVIQGIIVAEGQGRHGLLAAITTLGVIGAGLLMVTAPDLWLDGGTVEVIPLVAGLGCGLAAALLPMRALWPAPTPRLRAHTTP